jgi:hypothetical protein
MMRVASPFSRWTLGAGLVALSLSSAGGAFAQSKEELAEARAAFQEGVALAAGNNCAAALTKYRQVAKVKMTPQVAFNMADCEERLGRLVQALGDYRVAVSQAEGDKKAKEVLKQASHRVEALEARIPKLTIARGKGAESAVIELDGTEIGAGQLGSAVPVDPGPHVIVAKVSGKEQKRETVQLAEKENKTYKLELDLPPPKVETPPEEPKAPAAEEPKGRSKVPGAVVTAIGGASLITGFVALGLRAGALKELDTKCGGDTHCPPSAQPIADKGRLYTGLAEVGVIVGVVGLATGIALLATSGPPKKPSDQPSDAKPEAEKTSRRPTIRVVASAPGASIGGLSLQGRF